MNIQEYISSGKLESYVLGHLTPGEEKEVELLAAQHPEIRQEIDAIEVALEAYTESYAKTPSPSVKSRILKSIEKESKDIRRQDSTGSVRKMKQYSYLAAASVVLAILSIISSIYFYHNWQQAEQHILALETQNNIIASDFTKYRSSIDHELSQQKSWIGFLKDSLTKKVILKGQPVSPASQALVFWNTKSGEVFLNIDQLPPPPADKQYQLWAIREGKPVDAGIFDWEKGRLLKMKDISAAQAFAVTLEQKGGNTVPNLEALYILGNI